MNLSLTRLADCCAGRVIGKASIRLSGVKNLRAADSTSLSIYSDKHYLDQLSHSRAGAILTTPALAEDFSGNKILVENASMALTQILHAFSALNKTEAEARIAQSARISSSAQLGEAVDIGSHAVIGRRVKLADGVRIGAGSVIGDDVFIGEHSKIDANVTIYFASEIGARCHISSGTVIGADGFGFAENEQEMQWHAIPQIGKVILGNDVHIGANTTIDRGSLDDTEIEDDVIIDNLVQIAHNVKIGRHTAIAGCAGIAGSAIIGQNCKIGGRASILGHINICDDVVIFADSYVTKSISNAGIYSAAMPAMPLKKWQKTLARFRRQK